VRERETQELLKSGVMASSSRKGTASGTRRGTMGSPAFNKALAQNVAAEKVQMYGQVRLRLAAVGSGAQQQGVLQRWVWVWVPPPHQEGGDMLK